MKNLPPRRKAREAEVSCLLCDSAPLREMFSLSDHFFTPSEGGGLRIRGKQPSSNGTVKKYSKSGPDARAPRLSGLRPADGGGPAGV